MNEKLVTVNSISGGKTSSFMYLKYPTDVNIFALVCIDSPKCAPQDKSIIRFVNEKLEKSGSLQQYGEFIASAEHEKTLKVVRDLEQIGGREIVWVRGKSYDQVIKENSFLPSWNRRYCTSEMKVIPIAIYCYLRFGKVIMNIGFRGDEQERIVRFRNTFDMPIYCTLKKSHRQKWEKEIVYREGKFPLLSHFHLEIVSHIKKYYPQLQFPKDSNCMGCFHKTEQLIKANYLENKPILEWFASKEKLRKGRFKNEKNLTYEKIFKMNFTEDMFTDPDFSYSMCNSGGCTD